MSRRQILAVVVGVVIVLCIAAWAATGGWMPAIGPWRYTASEMSDKYHARDCIWASQIKRDKRVWFSTPQSAEDAGYYPCGLCQPDLQD